MPGPVSHGLFVWYDLMTPDPDGAASFYKEVAGWESAPWKEGATGPDGAPYIMWMAGEQAIGGRTILPAEAAAQGTPPHWLAYVTVPDANAAVEATLAAGGKVLMPATTLPEVGTFAVLQDPQGAAFCPFTPEQGAGGEVVPPGNGHFSWHELVTTDHESAFEFYSGLFGWEKGEPVDMGPMGVYQIFGPGNAGGFPYGGMFNKPPEMPAPPHWLYYIKVPDVSAAVEKVQALGGKLLNGPMDVPGGDVIAQCLDPQGAVFALHGPGTGGARPEAEG